MNKKHYIMPQIEPIEIETINLLQVSGEFGDPATRPAKVPLFDYTDDWDDWEYWIDSE